MLTSSIKQTRSLFVHAVMPRDKRVRLSCLLIQIIMRQSSEHFTLTTLELAKNLIVPLSSHHDLTVNVLNIHILTAIACIRSHQASLVSDASLYIVNGCG